MKEMNEEKRWELFSKHFGNELNEAEEYELSLWLEADLNHREEMEHARKIWDLSNQKEINSFDTDKSWYRLQKRINRPLEMKPEPARRVFMTLFKVAAGFLLLFILAYLITSIIGKPDYIEYIATARMKDKPITLADGTKVYLNAGAQLSYPKKFGTDSRTVKLTGEAFFDVTRNEKQPFIIKTPNANIQVLGTSFNVLACKRCDSVQVAVKTGTVELSSALGNDKLIISKGNTGVYYVNPNKLKLATSDINMNSFAWKTDSIIFQDSHLAYVTQTLERIFGEKIILENELIKNCPISGDFKDNLPNILNAIASSQGLKVIKTNKVYHLTGTGCK